MFDPFEEKSKKFLFWSLFFLFIVLLNFLLFHPKFYESDNLENLEYQDLQTEEIYNILITDLEPGDILLDKPASYSERYSYQNDDSPLNNRFIFFTYYNLFELLINSMGNGDYWHASIYIGDGKLNSLGVTGVRIDEIDPEFVNAYHFTILRPRVDEEIKLTALENAEKHLEAQDINYNFRNGLIIVFFRGTGINIHPRMKADKQVCSSYLASLYSPLKFQGNNFRYVTPVDLVDSSITKIIMVKNERGFIYEK